MDAVCPSLPPSPRPARTNMKPPRENDITDILYESFSITSSRFDLETTVELVPGGEEIPVTEANKADYVEKAVQYRIHGRVEEQFDCFMEGLLELVPRDLLSVFDERELELLVGGCTEIDMCVLPLPPSFPKTNETNFTNAQGRLVQIHRLPRLHRLRPHHNMVLVPPPLLAPRAQIPPPPIHHRHLARPRQRLQGSPGLRWPAEVHD